MSFPKKPIVWFYDLRKSILEHSLEVFEMGQVGSRQLALLVGRWRRCFPTEGVKEHEGGLVVGGNLFFQHSCLQRACLFTP